jgi:hypothetical protein
MRARLHVLALLLLSTALGNTQCLSVSSTSTLAGVTYHLWKPVTSAGLPCGSGDLVIYAHGYVTPVIAAADSWTSELTVGGVSPPAVFNQAGYAFAASSYSKTGLAIVEGAQDNIFGTADAQQELGGQPYDNSTRIYIGSSNDILLNLRVKRFKADPAALANVAAKYETTGKLKLPLVTLHTLSDPVIPYWHEPLYTGKTLFAGTLLDRVNLPVSAYGHCNFSSTGILAAFSLMVLRSTGSNVSPALRTALPEAYQTEFDAALRRHAAAEPRP